MFNSALFLSSMGNFWVNGKWPIRREPTFGHFCLPFAQPLTNRFLRVNGKQLGRLPFNKKFQKFRKGDKWNGNILKKFPENPEIVEFPKSKPFNRKFRKSREESQMEHKFPEEISGNFGIPHKVVQFSGNSGDCCTIRHWKSQKFKPEIFHWMEYSPGIALCCIWCFYPYWPDNLVKPAGSDAIRRLFGSPSHGEKLDNIMTRWHSECGVLSILRIQDGWYSIRLGNCFHVSGNERTMKNSKWQAE